MNRLCLNMIVKNEEDNLPRCLASVRPWISSYFICDTGSTDQTVAVIERELHGLPGKIIAEPFRDFSTTRNAALRGGQQFAQQAGADYLLLCDADMELRVSDPNFAARLTAEAYTISQRSAELIYDNVRLLRVGSSAAYEGVTHEFLACDVSTGPLPGVSFYDHASGSNRPGKLQRDAALLADAIAGADLVPRYMFYLAQSLRQMGQYRQALPWYEARVQLGGWIEEQWYAQYMVAVCLEKLGDPACIEAAAKATSILPHRAEAWMFLATYHRNIGAHEVAMHYARRAVNVDRGKHSSLFVSPASSTWQPWQEIGICAFYTGELEEGRNALHDLLLFPETGSAAKALARRNLEHYVLPLREYVPSAQFTEVDCGGADETHRQLNPSILIRADGERVMAVRSVNYEISTSQPSSYRILDNSAGIRTRNYLVRWRGEYRPSPGVLLTEQTPEPPYPSQQVAGFEDLRLFEWQSGLWATATSREYRPEGLCEQVLLKLSPDSIDACVPLTNPWEARHQKNWTPGVDDDGTLYLLYSFQPLRVLKVDPVSLQTSVHVDATRIAVGAEDWRGSSQMVRLDDGWLCCIHEHADYEDRPRRYYHRFVHLDEGFVVRRCSPLMTLRELGVEFCCGLAIENEDLYLTFGHWDRQAYLMQADLQQVRQILQPPRVVESAHQVG